MLKKGKKCYKKCDFLQNFVKNTKKYKKWPAKPPRVIFLIQSLREAQKSEFSSFFDIFHAARAVIV